MDEVTKSKRNPGQVDNALDFLLALVRLPTISASQVAIICPYKANVTLVERRRERLRYAALSGMPPAATVDSFQGREAEIIVVIMGTTEAVGPGFTTDEHRLNVLLSRQKSGLLIFGDINVLGPVTDRGTGGRGGRGGMGAKGRDRAVLKAKDGTEHFITKGMLFNVMRNWSRQGRVVTLPVRDPRD